MTIGQKIKARRKELGMSAEELGEKLGKNRSTIYRYENGDIEKLPFDFLEPIAKALQTTPEYLTGWNKTTEESEKNSKTSGGIAIRLLKDPQFLKVVSMLYSLDESQLVDVETLLKVSFKNSFNENK